MENCRSINRAPDTHGKFFSAPAERVKTRCARVKNENRLRLRENPRRGRVYRLPQGDIVSHGVITGTNKYLEPGGRHNHSEV